MHAKMIYKGDDIRAHLERYFHIFFIKIQIFSRKICILKNIYNAIIWFIFNFLI